MRKIVDGMYLHRGKIVRRDEQGIIVEGCLYLFKSFTDARNYIDMIHDGSNKKTPVIVGEWKGEK